MKRNIILTATLLLAIAFSACGRPRIKKSAASIPYEQSLLELPHPNVGTKGELRSYCGFNVSYNNDWRIPNWVAYELTREETNGPHSRKNTNFHADPMVAHSANRSDYSRSGYTRGHLVPAADMKWDAHAMADCHYMTNICPQEKRMNEGCWEHLEKKCREWAQKEGSICIVCGPIVTNDSLRIGENQVVVPNGFFKAVVQKRGDEYVGIGFVFPNKELGLPLAYFAVSIDDVEEITGFDLFHNLPDKIERKIEAETDYKAWGLREPESNILKDRVLFK